MNSIRNNVLETIKRMNPWWDDENWYEQDIDYNERVRKSPFVHRWFWILNRSIHQLLEKQGKYDILVLAGPRRTGKTSLLKRLIEENYSLIKDKTIYLRLDHYILKKEVENLGLTEILLDIIGKEELNEPLIILIDEASVLDNWDLHIKNTIDTFTSEDRNFLLLVTGSLGLRLIQGSSNILARRGDIPYLGSIANPATILPYKFSEYAEAMRSIRMIVRFMRFIKRENRLKALLDLAKPNLLESPEIQKLYIIYDSHHTVLEQLFDSYLISGGFPLILYELLVKGKFEKLDKKWYDEIKGSLMQDLKYVELRKDIAEHFFGYLSDINKMSPLLDLNKLEKFIRANASLSKRDLRQFKIENYIDYFSNIFSLVKATNIAQIREDTKITRQIKLFITDPFIFHSIMFKDYDDPLIESKNFLKEPYKKGILVEHVICSHFLRLTTKPTLYYYLYKEKNQTLSELDCICHYRRTYIPIEVKYTEDEKMLKNATKKANEILNTLKI
ncbi:MAG: AAA family ATPase, partial [Promethearchaeota archaeon]